MPTCQNCNQKWSWKQTLKSSLTLATGMICPYCKEKQYVTSRTRKRSSLVGFIAPILMLLNIFFGPSIAIVFILIVFFPLFLGIYPYWIELSNEEEFLW